MAARSHQRRRFSGAAAVGASSAATRPCATLLQHGRKLSRCCKAFFDEKQTPYLAFTPSRGIMADGIGQRLMQPNPQPNDQPRRRRGPGRPFRPGKSGNPLGGRLMIEKRAAMQAEITAELGGQLSATDEMMLQRAVELLTRRPQSHNEAVRLINAGSRIIGQLRAKYAKREPSGSSLAEYLASLPAEEAS
jgi:hypothetical protein